MSDPRVKTLARRRHRRHHKRLRGLLGTLGAVSIGLGAIVSGIAVVTSRSTLLSIGAGYILCGGALILLRWGLQRTGSRSKATARGGMALILALLLVAVLGALVMYSLNASHVALRHARDRQVRVAAQATVVDAAWNALHEIAAGRMKAGDSTVWLPPAGLPAHVRLSRDRRARSHGGNLLLHVSAETNQVRHEVYCVAQQHANGTVTPTRWIEP
ncbi:MAG: hypothetical protein O2923_09965 [Verrucomicrobia bacterium]|nr:hypothetical protein [Verrucomicrobiota bacterium]MDA1086984.1 hypothetical protein [Verrucomicrobiota bacterium]